MLHKDGARIHKDESYEKDYLIDKYGAIPILKSIDIFKGAGDLGNIKAGGTERMSKAKGDRTGNRKSKEQRRKLKVPELGYYLIVTGTEGTERCFFIGLHHALPKLLEKNLLLKLSKPRQEA